MHLLGELATVLLVLITGLAAHTLLRSGNGGAHSIRAPETVIHSALSVAFAANLISSLIVAAIYAPSSSTA